MARPTVEDYVIKPWAQKVNDWLDKLDELTEEDIAALDAACSWYRQANGI